MTARIQDTTLGQWPALRLSNDKLELVIVPTFGGKLTSLRSRASGRQWLWNNPHLQQRDPTGQTDYTGAFDTGGWDEVFPTVASCFVRNTPWGDQRLRDHGEIWRRQAEVISSTSIARRVGLRVNGDSQPFTFERTMTLAESEAQFEIAYRLTNHADQPLPYIWAAHPLLKIEPGMRIDLPDHTQVICTGGTGKDLPEFGRPFSWPAASHDSSPLDLGRVPQAMGGSLKLFTQPIDPLWVQITTVDGAESFRIDVDAPCSHRVGMWLNYGGWSGSGSPPYFNAGIEPTTSPCETLTDAMAQNVAAVVPPNDSQHWTLAITLT